MIFCYKGYMTGPRKLTGGAPQGCLLSGIIFIVKFNSALLRPPIERPLHSKSMKAKYHDDTSLAVSVNMKEALIIDSQKREKPLKYSERTNHVLPAEQNLLQTNLLDFEDFTHKNKMKINNSKTKVMKFTRSTGYDFPLEVSFSDNTHLEQVKDTKLLGIIISDSLKWDMNTEYICKRAKCKLFLLRNMMRRGLNISELLDAYKKEIRSLLELAVPVWHSGITLEQQLKIERVQKSALSIILGMSYITYDNALKVTKLDRLSTRREFICNRFIHKNMKSEKPFFKKVLKSKNTRSDPNKVTQIKCRTTSYYKSSLPFLARKYNHNLKSSKSMKRSK